MTRRPARVSTGAPIGGAAGAARAPLEAQLELLREDDPDPFESHWRQAGEWLAGAVALGEDITPALALLEERFRDSHQVPAMEAIAAALVAHHARHRSLDRLLPLAREVAYGDTVILRRIEPLTRRRGGLEATLPLLLGVLPRSSLHILTVLLERVGGSQARLDRIIAALAEKPATRQLVPELVKEAIHQGAHRRVSLAQAMPVLASLIADPETRLVAVLSLVWIVEAGVDVTALLPALEGCLGDPFAEIRHRAAYALAFALTAAGQWKRLDALLAADDAGFRHQAVRALGLNFLAFGRRGAAEATRLAMALLDAAPEVRRSARTILGSERVGGAIELDDGALGRLAAALDDPERGEDVGEVLHRLAESGPARARRLAALLAGLSGGRRVEQLERACRAFETAAGARACAVCRRIPRASGSSEPLKLLVPELPESESRDRSCPECGAYYHYSYSEEWRSPSDGMGVDIEIELQRLTPPEMRRRLPPTTLATVLPDYEAAIERCRTGLDHAVRYLREDSARALVLDDLEREGSPGLPGLLGHADPVVRAAAVATLHEVWQADTTLFPLARLAPVLTGLLADTETAVRTQAAHMVCEDHAGRGDVVSLQALLASPDPLVKCAVIAALNAHPEVDAAPFVDELERLLRHEAKEVRTRAAGALVGRARRGHDAVRILQAFLSLATPDGALTHEAADAVADLDWAGTTLGPAALTALTATLGVEDARYHAFDALQRAARGGTDISPAFARLLAVAGDRGDHSGYRDDALHIVETALPAALRAGADISAVLAAAGELLTDPSEEVRRVAAECLKVPLQAGLELSSALPPVVAALTAPRVSYIESYLAEDVALWLVRRRDFDTLGRLLAGAPEISGMVGKVLAKVASEGLSLEPLLEPLLACLTTRSWYTRDNAAVALANHVRRHPLWAETLRKRLATLDLDNASTEIRNLAAAVGWPLPPRPGP